ncbi:MAG TPA: tetratricopeptide repeat protein [Bryobacteraceae bacterium]|nr:tetratricopeptide repeat protein [Bryobacteraceae bacterium]
MSALTGLRWRVLLVSAAILFTPAFAQRGGSSGGAPVGGNPGTGSSGGTSQPGTGTPGQTAPQGTQNGVSPGPIQPIFITGRVMLDDGTPPPQSVAIQRVCGGSPHIEGYTNGEGYFSITLGSTFNGVFQDATTSGHTDDFGPGSSPGQPLDAPAGSTLGAPTGISPWMNCELRAQLAGYQSQSVNLMNRQAMDDPNIGTILLHRHGPSEGTMVSATELAAPKGARQAYEKGLDLLKKKKLDEARASFAKAVEQYPRYAAAWTQLGGVAEEKGDQDAARHAFEQAIQADAKYVVPYVQLSLLHLRARQWKETADTSEKAIRLDPFSYPQAYFFNAVAHFNLQELKSAEDSARRAQQLDTRHQIPEVSRLLAVILANRQDYRGAVSEMRDYLKLAPQAGHTAEARAQLERFEEQMAAHPAQPEK